ncbi:MAG: hypothetical protein UW68_C0018G0006 [Candidatus Collierbacteria bacterium GW2011_GWB1_44_6]|uniref:Uncharacterized protein n=1 Tax=Candidatus Collierbacteria bacterium GW2011_GWB1_44_6 TaxID=1618384 RepID=A0A0G1LW39_9BACT|nr:MAG: hypothetical protein UW68_C0018G0006 [Candidatus Collierbacteria bacterium GW2011_GWB1_44_6]
MPTWMIIVLSIGFLTIIVSLYVRKLRYILVWNKYQKKPARLYGDHWYGRGKYIILVCKDPNIWLEKLGKEKAVIYHFN